MIDRSAMRRAYRPTEADVVAERLEQARLDKGAAAEAKRLAKALVKAVRGHKPAGLDAFLQAYDLGSDEGVALMCLAEALLRIPDAHTADELIDDKRSGTEWARNLADRSRPSSTPRPYRSLDRQVTRRGQRPHRGLARRARAGRGRSTSTAMG